MDNKYVNHSQKPKSGIPDASLLKNIRQIGNMTPGYKLYVEDSVINFLHQQLKSDDNRVIALTGSEKKTDGNTYVYVTGAIKVDDIYVTGRELSFGQRAFTGLYEEMNTFFGQSSLLGWYVPMYEMIKNYASALGEKCRLFMIEDPTGQGEIFYIKEAGRVKKLSGYNIYYDSNDAMKNYLLSCKEEYLKTTEKQVYEEEKAEEYDTVREYRDERKKHQNIIKKEEKINSRLTPLLYAASTVLAIVVLVVGISLMSNYEKMHKMQSTLETLAGKVNETISRKTIAPDATALSDSPEPISTEDVDKTTEPVQTASVDEESSPMSTGTNSTDIVEYYVVKEGDTLAGISKKLFDSVNRVEDICKLNGIENEDSLYIGQKLYLPKETEHQS